MKQTVYINFMTSADEVHEIRARAPDKACKSNENIKT